MEERDMPKYDFHCNICERDFETTCSHNDLAKVSCPHCDSPDVKRLYTRIGFLRGAPACADGCATATPSCSIGGGAT
jgi:putative FmdB family regulatory protein